MSSGVLEELYNKHRLEELCSDVNLSDLPVDQWPASAFSVQQGASVSTLLAADTRAHGVRIATSSVFRGARGVYAERSFAAGESILQFYGLIIYDDLTCAASQRM